MQDFTFLNFPFFNPISVSPLCSNNFKL